jgi:hypothetical protein
MRVSANIVESLLASAQAEIAAERREGKDREHSKDFQGLVEAFRRADELRREEFIFKKVRGRKSGAWQTVITTTQRNGEWTLCLLRYDGRCPFKFTTSRTDERGKVILTQEVFKSIIPMFREQWIRNDRLEAA